MCISTKSPGGAPGCWARDPSLRTAGLSATASWGSSGNVLILLETWSNGCAERDCTSYLRRARATLLTLASIRTVRSIHETQKHRPSAPVEHPSRAALHVYTKTRSALHPDLPLLNVILASILQPRDLISIKTPLLQKQGEPFWRHGSHHRAPLHVYTHVLQLPDCV